tara:strand:- start:133760 stop:134065 length:306 start_codon:yes stop_codon:yes gene_type:complete
MRKVSILIGDSAESFNKASTKINTWNSKSKQFIDNAIVEIIKGLNKDTKVCAELFVKVKNTLVMKLQETLKYTGSTVRDSGVLGVDVNGTTFKIKYKVEPA